MTHCVHILKNAQLECTGIARIVKDLAVRSAVRGYPISVLFLGDGPLASTMQQHGIPVSVVPWTGDRTDLSGALNAWRWMRTQAPAIVHLHHGGSFPGLVCRASGVKTIVRHVHGQIVEPHGRAVPRLSRRGANAVIACSEAAAGGLRGCDVEVIHAGIDVPTEPPAAPMPDGPLRIGVLARLVKLKRIDLVIEAVAQLTRMGVPVEAEIAGTGEAETALRELAGRLEVASRVHFLGWREDPAALLASWHALVMPSVHEGFPVAALEAMAAGRAVVASRVGGLREQVVDGVTGRFFDDADGLVSALVEISHDRVLAAQMGQEGWRRAREHFSADRMAEQTMALYDRLLGKNRSGTADGDASA